LERRGRKTPPYPRVLVRGGGIGNRRGKINQLEESVWEGLKGQEEVILTELKDNGNRVKFFHHKSGKRLKRCQRKCPKRKGLKVTKTGYGRITIREKELRGKKKTSSLRA